MQVHFTFSSSYKEQRIIRIEFVFRCYQSYTYIYIVTVNFDFEFESVNPKVCSSKNLIISSLILNKIYNYTSSEERLTTSSSVNVTPYCLPIVCIMSGHFKVAADSVKNHVGVPNWRIIANMSWNIR